MGLWEWLLSVILRSSKRTRTYQTGIIMAKSITSQQFKAGDRVACYSGEVVTFGEVINVDGGITTVSIECNVYPKNAERTTQLILVDYVRRDSDGLSVLPECVSQRVPESMIAYSGEMNAINKWRYWPSPIEKLKRRFMS